ncbi:MAG: hypothetical protein EWV79_17490 [Microcystis aeruginosa Ma_MB_S_20031200_S102D]|nr:MAG: hypothetical protein EWV79_17490 [Microcystis aeruginosa Ma_MB_S_20031200_S102D]
MLHSSPGEPLKAKVSINLSSEAFPDHAQVCLEAYHRSSGMRFDLGSIGTLKVPPLLVLSEVDRSGSVLFRLKVVDSRDGSGKILGSALGIQPSNENEIDGKRSLFPVNYRDLGEEIWKVEINEGDRPRLLLSNRVQAIPHKLQTDALFQGLVLPAALRIVIENLAREPESDDEDETGWKQEWMQYCRDSLGASDDPSSLDDEKKKDWVDDVVRRFCNGYQFVQGIKKMELEIAGQ